MEGAESIKLNDKETNFLKTLNWMESTTYLGRAFILDIDFENYGVTLYGAHDVVDEFRADLKQYADYIEENTDGNLW
jgi:hypothetical protein